MDPSLLSLLQKSPLKPLSLLFAGVLLAPLAGAADSWWPDIQVEVKVDQAAAVEQSLVEAALGRTASAMGAIPRWSMM